MVGEMEKIALYQSIFVPIFRLDDLHPTPENQRLEPENSEGK